MTIEEVFKNKELLIEQKKNTIKHCDNIFSTVEITTKQEVNKAGDNVEIQDPTTLKVKLVINTTNLIDSHADCHIPNLWAKSLTESKILYLLQEHEMEFDKIISDSVKDELKAYTETKMFKELNYNLEGSTECLIFDTKIKQEVNPFMFNLYKQGRIYNHSVGMRYIKLFLCIDSDSPEMASEKENWDKYISYVANKDEAERRGYFWAVTEAKVIEGSAVLKGSNECTPVLQMEIEKEIEAVEDTSKIEIEPSTDTQKRRRV